MEIKFEVKMTQKIMYNFLLNHTYRSTTGVVGVLFGVVALAFGIINMNRTQGFQSMIFILFGGWFLLYLPITLYLRSAKQVQLNQVFKKPITYVLNEEGISTMQDGQKAEMKWEELVKVRETKLSLLVYTGKRYSVILPKESMGEQYSAVVQMLQKHVAPEKIKIKNK